MPIYIISTRVRASFALILVLLSVSVQGQIKIGGNVYGGGNAGDLGGKTSVEIYSGDLNGKVFGGAKMANVGGSTFVKIDGEHMSGNIIINQVYGGNDISGTIGTSSDMPFTPEVTSITNQYNAFVLTTPERKESTTTTGEGGETVTTESQPYKLLIGQLFGGGYGDYHYTLNSDKKTYTIKLTAASEDVITSSGNKPELDRAYLQINGGTFGFIYGGGDAVTVKAATDICINIDNENAVTKNIKDSNGKEILDDTDGTYDGGKRLSEGMALNLTQTHTQGDFQIARVFGGNNMAPMAIRPTWHLKEGKIRALYSGGNAGDMTYSNGILLEIPADSHIIVDDVYGGCRMADVNPDQRTILEETINGVWYPDKYAARVLVLGGNINNVYGGNDISGNVYGGNAVGIHHSIRGDVYGGGNGSYAYTDNPTLGLTDAFKDFYYSTEGYSGTDASAKALNDHRPNAEAVSIRLVGTSATQPTIIGGAVYCGGNSATLKPSGNNSTGTAQLKVGSYVYADKVFFGNNGENMISKDILTTYADNAFKIKSTDTESYDFSQMVLTDASQFATYMDGAAMRVKPEIVFDTERSGTEDVGGDNETYVPYSTFFGSVFGGGNVGSMKFPGKVELNFSNKVVIFDKLVGGCNNAYVKEQWTDETKTTKLNAAYEGGVLEENPNNADASGNKLVLNLSGLEIQPKRWKGTKDANGNYTSYELDGNDNRQLEWNTQIDGVDVAPVTSGGFTANDRKRRLVSGNVYGGCCESGIVAGNVVINVNSTLMDPDKLFDKVTTNEEGEAESLYGDNVLDLDNITYTIEERRTGVIRGQQGMDVLGKALNIFGGGYGKDTEIWGSTTINLNGGYVFQVFGGSEQGVIGKPDASGNYAFNGKTFSHNDSQYSCYINLKGTKEGVSISGESSKEMAECEFIYGGGFMGPVCGSTYINLGNGRIFNSFAGACNSDILGHTETYIGRQVKNEFRNAMGIHVSHEDDYESGFPYIRDYIYCGNDLGGRIMSTENFSSRVRTDVAGMTNYSANAKNASAYVEYQQGRALGIFGGCYGTYDYQDAEFENVTYTKTLGGEDEQGNPTYTYETKEGFTKPRMDNAFVNFRPNVTAALKSNANNTVGEIYGAGQGYPGDSDRDIMQKRSYILIDIPQDMENFKGLEVWGAGAWSGLGMTDYLAPVANPTGDQKTALDNASAIIDLTRGQIAAAYGGSYQEGVTRRTVVNVPEGSTIRIGSIFGGAYGTQTYSACDVYESNVNYNSSSAVLVCEYHQDENTKKWVGDKRYTGAVYGGNNNERRTLYGRVNINSEVKQYHWKYKMTLGTVYGAGYGGNTWAEYTEVNLNNGAHIYEAYGGGQAGKVYNSEGVQRFKDHYKPRRWPDSDEYPKAGQEYTDEDWAAAWRLSDDYDPATGVLYWENQNTNLKNPLVRVAEVDDRDFEGMSEVDKSYVEKRYNTNVIIHRGAIVENYAYGGGLGEEAVVAGTTYIALLGGTVKKDIYAAGTSGAVQDLHKAGVYSSTNRAGFMASANAYIAGGTVRNVYGGGWKGSVGRHKKFKTNSQGEYVLDISGNNIEVDADINDPAIDDISGETHVIIGIRKDQPEASLLAAMTAVKGSEATLADYGFYSGQPAIQRNAYAGGEGGAVYGKAHLTINSGYLGYEYVVPQGATEGSFVEKVDDETYYDEETGTDGSGRLRDCGNVFGGGYDALSSVDESSVTIYGGEIRGSVHGGGEIATIGRGSVKESSSAGSSANSVREFEAIYRIGHTHVEMFNGHVHRNIFGGGKGYNLLGYGGSSELYTDGYTFGQTEVYIHGGEVGTEEGLAEGYGNVFGGGDLGFVYSKGYDNAMSRKTETNSPNHYYYYYNDYKCKTAYGQYKKDDVIDASFYNALSTTDKANWEAASAPTLIEDCKVVVSPMLQLKKNAASITIGGKNYGPYDYVPTDYLNTLTKDKSQWTDFFTGDNRYLKNEQGEILKDENGNYRINPDDPDERGVHIRNAVFAGGNVASNSDRTYANATTVHGNTTATLYDVYHRDFITVGTEHTGGLYGGGNLSVVDGYRELNITNYGTDYYNLSTRIDLAEYRSLSNRERAYFQLQYECQEAYTGTLNGQPKSYQQGNKKTEEEYNALPADEKGHWAQYGFCSIYAGRLLNTIQRADFCGVYGSRLVLQGAKDRVAEVGEDINYTINRVGEVSLNGQHSVIPADLNSTASDAWKEKEHGNYFGIYSIVNYLGNLTSDVSFVDDYHSGGRDEYNVDKGAFTGRDGVNYDRKSYYTNKRQAPTANDRNKGRSYNEVALASGVFLELTTEQTELNPDKKKVYGYISGVVELDLINTKQIIEGGGFVYAKNEHRVPMYYPNKSNVILSEYNKQNGTIRDEARTYKRFRYSNVVNEAKEPGSSCWADKEWTESSGAYVCGAGYDNTAYEEKVFQTSGNFIHHEKRIVDDCYPENNRYEMADPERSEAHFWYIKGSVYVYDQIVSAYTGAASAYSKAVHLPLTITAASHGKLKLLNVKPNKYAYYYAAGQKIDPDNDDPDKTKVWVNKQADSYELNDVITWWDWHNLPTDEQALFVDETYVNVVACNIDGDDYGVGEYVMLNTSEITTGNHTVKYTDDHGDEQTLDLTKAEDVATVFRTSNNIGHNTGYVLTFDMDTPDIWNDYKTNNIDKTDKIRNSEFDTRYAAADEAEKVALNNTYTEGPTFNSTADVVLGKREYNEGDIIDKEMYDRIADDDDHISGNGKENLKPAYVATRSITYTYTYTDENSVSHTVTKTINTGTAIPETEYSYLNTSGQSDAYSAFKAAYVCATSIKLADENYLLLGDLLTEEEIQTLKDKFAVKKDQEGHDVTDDQGHKVYTSLADDIDAVMRPAYICTKTGEYGGQLYEAGTNYSAIQSWCALPAADRENFTFNYDALDLFADPDYTLVKTIEQAYHTPYSDEVPMDYRAVFKGTTNVTSITLTDGTTINTNSAPLSNSDFENKVKNDKLYYTHVNTTDVDASGYFYVVTDNFDYNGRPYGKGQVVDADIWNSNNSKVEQVEAKSSANAFYYCFESKPNSNTFTIGGTTYTIAKGAEKGGQISADIYDQLPDDQQYFAIQGKEPNEKTTLYVNRESDIKDVTQEKVITVVYQYTYYEPADDNNDSQTQTLKLTNELHVVNIHLQLESGHPTIGPLQPAPTVLPGDVVGLTAPHVTPGIYEALTNGWELFATKDDADHHRNGTTFVNNSDPVYWYQNQKNYVAFYTKTYLGKVYSNYVPLSVANYHDLADIMERHKDNHLYIDRSDVDRPCKIYINNYSDLPDTDERKGKNGLDELKALFNLSTLTNQAVDANGLISSGDFTGHAPLGDNVRNAAHLDIILRTDLAAPEGEWTSIAAGTGETDPCFSGNIHGDGHTVSGLSSSLFGKLCGDVYNLGVTGSFTSAGLADTGDGFVENCWVKSSAKTGFAADVNPVFGHPSRTLTEGETTCTQLVNCYYAESNPYQTKDYSRGMARQMPDRAFYNGEVAYDLNGFYLGKRFFDGRYPNGNELASKMPYQYIKANADGSLPTNAETGQTVAETAYYPEQLAWYVPMNTKETPELGYVEHRFYDGDFRFADGTIPETRNIRRQEKEVGTTEETKTTIVTWAPIWPDDYLFFGQTLTYGHVEERTHQDLPAVINKTGERLTTSELANRVLRAPAYFRNSKMGVAHFNQNAVFAATKKNDASVEAYKDMTAIDFSGGNGDVTGAKADYQQGLVSIPAGSVSRFYPPLLDDAGLTSFLNVDLTKNLLAYTIEGTTTDGVVGAVMHDFAYEDYQRGDDANSIPPMKEVYNAVAEWDYTANYKGMQGHYVQLSNGSYKALNDHFLVDDNDFSAPIGYRFANGQRMWYQRTPDNFAGQKHDGTLDKASGWEAVSLPFSAETVTTQNKGELTHFYQGSTIGHEYWLKELSGEVKPKEGNIYEAGFDLPAVGDNEKDYTNTFLWDYYYSKSDFLDRNSDEYKKGFYSSTYLAGLYPKMNYPYSQAGTPYLVGFPGKMYYEFDLSGAWTPQNRYNLVTIDSPGPQVITFASKTGIEIKVSEQEISRPEAVVESNGYTYRPTYLRNPDITGLVVYQMNADGSRFDKTDASNVNIRPFRPYFTSDASTSGARTRGEAEQIVFAQTDSKFGIEEDHNLKEKESGSLDIYAKRKKIVVESNLREITDVRIVNTAGITINTFSIEPGETVETRIYNSGVYIVQTEDGHYNKKLIVR